jgi:hypothetical protein
MGLFQHQPKVSILFLSARWRKSVCTESGGWTQLRNCVGKLAT